MNFVFYISYIYIEFLYVVIKDWKLMWRTYVMWMLRK